MSQASVAKCKTTWTIKTKDTAMGRDACQIWSNRYWATTSIQWSSAAISTYRTQKCKPRRILQLQPFGQQEAPLRQYCKDDRGDDLFRLQLSFSPTLFNNYLSSLPVVHEQHEPTYNSIWCCSVLRQQQVGQSLALVAHLTEPS